MSRAFVKDDAPDGPPIIPPRAPLPPGTPNYVTPRGLALLRAERAELEAERARLGALPTDSAGRQRELEIVAGQLANLTERLASAQLVPPAMDAPEQVRFGTTVEVRMGDGETRRFTLVGVDEADAAAGRVAFVAPIARALIGKRAGESATLRTPRGEDMLTILSIGYEAE